MGLIRSYLIVKIKNALLIVNSIEIFIRYYRGTTCTI